MEVYRHSGAVPLGGALTTLATGAVVAVVLGILYALGVHYVPFIFIRFFLTILLGAGVGLMVAWSNKRAKIRNSKVLVLLAGVSGLVALYIAWAGKLATLTDWQAGLPLDPLLLGRFMGVLYENGSWTLKGGQSVTGIPLVLIWLVEAGLIVGLAVQTASSAFSQRPFCEPCGQWTKAEKAVQRLMVRPEDAPRLAQAMQGDLSGLAEIPPAPQGSSTWVQLDLATCPHCAESAFLTISNVQETVNKKGETQTVTRPLVTNLILRPQDVELVRQAGSTASSASEPPQETPA